MEGFPVGVKEEGKEGEGVPVGMEEEGKEEVSCGNGGGGERW